MPINTTTAKRFLGLKWNCFLPGVIFEGCVFRLFFYSSTANHKEIPTQCYSSFREKQFMRSFFESNVELVKVKVQHFARLRVL